MLTFNLKSAFLVLFLSGTIPLATGTVAWADEKDDPFHLNAGKSGGGDRYLELGMLGMTRGNTENFERGWGGLGIADVTRLSPLVFRFGIGFSTARPEPESSSSHDGLSVSVALSALIRPSTGSVLPYAGGGLSFVSNSYSTSDAPRDYWPVDRFGSGDSFSYDLGSGFGWHLSAGLAVPVSNSIKIIADLTYQVVYPSLTVSYIELPSGRQLQEEIDYDFSALYLSLGVSFAVKSPIS